MVIDPKLPIAWKDILPNHIDGLPDKNKLGEYHFTEFGTLYKGTEGTILHDNFGVESRHTYKGSLLTFNRHTIERLKGQLNSKISIKNLTALTTLTAPDEGGTKDNESSDPPCQGSSASSASSLSSQPAMQKCAICGTELEAFYMRIHRCDGTD